MTEHTQGSASQFSSVGSDYHAQLARGLDVTGESAAHFARRRIARVKQLVAARRMPAHVILDFGCGPGTSFAFLRDAFPHARIIGFEPADGLRLIAEQAAQAAGAEVISANALSLDREVDVVYCNGVFHHIPVDERRGAMQSIARALRVHGAAFTWENSPFNPGTRWVMSRVPFDHDAVLLRPAALRALQHSAHLTPVDTEFHFVFPHALRALRFVESALLHLPLGGQYLVIGERRGETTDARRGNS